MHSSSVCSCALSKWSRARWNELVIAVAEMDGVARKLLADHKPDETGKCVGCTLPGYGTPAAQWPCSLRELAVQAEGLRTKRTG